MRGRCRSAVFTFLLAGIASGLAQDSSSGAIRGLVVDQTNAAVAGAVITVTNQANGVARELTTDSQGSFDADLLPAADYTMTARYEKFTPYQQSDLHVAVGAVVAVNIRMTMRRDVVAVSGEAPVVETQSSSVSNAIEESAIQGLPLNGRRFSDLALLTPGVTQDPRSLTSSSNGDLAFGGLRGYHSLFQVDGSDNNNGFFAQARGRYRAPYQFSNEVVQEFTVSSNSYGAELGGGGGAVINVVTKSGSDYFHGSGFYFVRDSAFNARPPFLDFKPQDRQHQFGFTVGGPIKKDRAFFFAGFDQHLFHVPAVVEFANGSRVLVPVPTNGIFAGDYEPSDQALVLATAAKLNALAGEQRTALLGNAGFARVDVNLSPKQYLNARVSTSRFYGQNNVFFDPASPIVDATTSNNGEEDVSTESASLALTSALTSRLTSHARVQFSRDLQQSSANSNETLQRIFGVINLGRSDLLPRFTREHRLHMAETLSLAAGRNSWKVGGDLGLLWITDYFPAFFGGQYRFDPIKVNPFTFVPQEGGLQLTPLRAFAHEVPKHYEQDFGRAMSHPDSREYSAFLQDSIRVTDHLALNLGARYDLQTFRSEGLVSNPLWPDSGKVPTDTDNFAPRAGFAYSIGDWRPLVVRGGGGIFYTVIPQIYTSAVELGNGLNQQKLSLNNSNYFDRQIFPVYPNPLVNCPPGTVTCTAPAYLTGKLTADISTFSHNFQIPYVEQANASVEKEVGGRIGLEANYLYVHGVHLIRARDVNLPKPVVLSYPVFDDSGTNFLGTFYSVDSFSTWQFTPSFTCPFPPCINPLARPEARLGAVNTFESESSSVYHAFTFSARRRMSKRMYFELAYTLAHAIDDNQSAPVVGVTANVQNTFATKAERGNSVTDQRQRLVASWMAEPHPFHQDHASLGSAFNNWKLAGIVTVGSGRPVNARISGDANGDGNSENDRLPGVRRNSFTSPDYATTDVRLSRVFHLNDQLNLELLAESFNILNRDNKRIVDATTTTDNGSQTIAANFVPLSKQAGALKFPAYFRNQSSFLKPTTAYAPRQVQLAVKLRF